MNTRARTILLIMLILSLFSVAILALMQLQQEQEIKIIKDKHFSIVKKSYTNISKRYENHYDKIVSNIFNDTAFKQAFKDKNKAKAYKLFFNQYTSLKKQNNNLLDANFYTPDNKLFLNMNQLSIPSKNERFIRLVNSTKKSMFSAFSDNRAVVFKSIHPIFYAQEYLGCVEFNISAKYILDDMKKYTNVDGFMFLNSTSALYYNTMKNMLLLSMMQKNTSPNTMKELRTRKGEIYSTYMFRLNNSMGIGVANLYFFNNITQEINKFENNLYQITIFLISMVLLTIIIVAIGVSKSLKSLQNTYDNLYEYTDMIDDNIMIVDTTEDGLITGASQRFCDVSGYSQDELIAKPFKSLKNDAVDDKVYKELNDSLEKEGKWSGDFNNLDKNGNAYWLSAKIEKKLKDGKFVCYNYIMHNITDKKTSESLAFKDDLTSLYNRKYFNDIFPRMVNGIKRNGGCVNFVVLDIDHFSSYNEEYGAQMADGAIVQISSKLQESLRRPDDYSFRLGGGEFAVLFRSASEDEGYMYTQVLRKNIEMLGIEDTTNVKFKVMTASFGLASFSHDRIVDEKDVYKKAYAHLRRAKEDGKNKVVYKLV